MKRIVSVLLISVCCLSICSCGKKTESKKVSAKSASYDYGINGAVSFAVSDKGLWTISEHSDKAVLYDDAGAKIKEVTLGEGEHTDLNIQDDTLVCFSYTQKGPAILEYDLDSDESSSYLLSEEITGALSMAVTHDEIYLIYWKYNEHDDIHDENASDDGYMNLGETAVVIDRKTHDSSPLEIENAMALYKISDSQIMYYLHDDDLGYSYSIYDTEKKAFSPRKPVSIDQYIFAFAYDKDDSLFFTTDRSNRRLVAVDLSKGSDSGEVQLMSNITAMTGNDIKYDNGYCYVLNDITRSIVRVSVKKAMNNSSNNTLTLYRTMNMSDPYGCGYFIKTQTLEDDEFALSVMAGDSDYDLCMVNTAESKAKEIRDKGAFYPLNDVPGVSEYLNKCQDYVKKTAIDSSGDIWMIPVDIDIPFLLYNESNTDSAQTESLSTLLEYADRLYDKKSSMDWYSLNGYQLQQYLIDQYNASSRHGEKVEYRTKDFKELCELIKTHSADTDESLHTWVKDSSGYSENLNDYYDHYIFSLSHYYDLTSYDDTVFKTMRAKALPGLHEGKTTNYGTCICLCVNPSSDHLDQTLEYISSFCRYMSSRDDLWFLNDSGSRLFSDSRLSSDMTDIYKNGGICFEFPDDIFWNTYFDYQSNKISFDDMAKELDRKVDVYLNE